MVSLYKRATPRQTVVLRMVEGAVRNAAHAHPECPINDRMARSIAKRAAGTLTSQWGSVLAAPRVRSDGGSGHEITAPAMSARSELRGASKQSWRTPLHCLAMAIGSACGKARRDGSPDREEAFRDVLRLIAAVVEMDAPPRPGRDRLEIGPKHEAMERDGK